MLKGENVPFCPHKEALEQMIGPRHSRSKFEGITLKIHIFFFHQKKYHSPIGL